MENVWNFLVSRRLRFLIEWFNSYHQTYGHSPYLEDLTQENLRTLPEEREGIKEMPEKQSNFGRYSMSPARKSSNITNRKLYESRSTIGSQAVKRRNVKLALQNTQSFLEKLKTGFSSRESSDQLNLLQVLIMFYKMKNLYLLMIQMKSNMQRIWHSFAMHFKILGQIQ